MEAIEQINGARSTHVSAGESALLSNIFAKFDHYQAPASAVDKSSQIHFGYKEVCPPKVVRLVGRNNPTRNGNTLYCRGSLNALMFFVASEKIQYCVNTDPSLDMRIIWDLFIAAVSKSATPEQAIDEFIRTFLETEFHDKKFKVVEGALALKVFFLSRKSPLLVPGGFTKIKEAVDQGNIFSVCLDYCDRKRVDRFVRLAKSKGLTANVVYASSAMLPLNGMATSVPECLYAMNTLASPDKGQNVTFIACSPAAPSCSCVREALTVVTTNHLEEVALPNCELGFRHIERLLERLQFDCTLFVLGKFDEQVAIEQSYFSSTIVKRCLERNSLELVRKRFDQIRSKIRAYGEKVAKGSGLPPIEKEKLEAFQLASTLFTKLYDSAISEMTLPLIKPEVFIQGLRNAYFPEIAKRYVPKPELKGQIVPEAIFIIEEIFTTISVGFEEILHALP